MFKSVKFALILICLAAANVVMAQSSDPTVEIILSQPVAKQGDIITADIYVRDAVNVGGADIGITVDDKCIRIISRDAGTFLPMTSEQGGFLPFSELNDYNTRLAAAITDRTKLGNGAGLFYRIQFQVTCSQGVAQFNVTFAEFSAYKDPSAKEIELFAYTMGQGNVITRNTTLTIGAGSAEADTANVPDNPLAATAVLDENPGANSPLPLMIVLVLAVLGGGSLFIVFFIARRSRKEQQEV